MGIIIKNGIQYSGGSSGTASLPPGGTTGQVLAKKSNNNGDVEWTDPTSVPLNVEYVTASEAEAWFN